MSQLDPFRRSAERYYATEEFGIEITAFRELIQAQADKLSQCHIALDLEGVLVSLPVGRPGIDPRDRVIRPLAQTLVDTLAEIADRLTIWTAATDDYARDCIKSSGLKIPPTAHYVPREKFLKAPMDNSGKTVAKFLIDANRKLPICTGITERLLIKTGRVKICNALGVDLLLDDSAAKHKSACIVLGLDEDGDRIMPVAPFEVTPRLALELHQINMGLTQAASQIRGNLL